MGRPGLSLSPGKAWNLRVETGKGTGQNEQNGAGIQGWTKSEFYQFCAWGGNPSFRKKDEKTTNKLKGLAVQLAVNTEL